MYYFNSIREGKYGPDDGWRCESQVTKSLSQARKDKKYYLFAIKRASESDGFIYEYPIKPEVRVVKRSIRVIRKKIKN